MRDGDGVRLRAQCRHVGTVVTISGDVDPANVDRVADFATRFAVVANAVVLDLSDARFPAVQAISVLIAVDDACRTAQVPWILIPSGPVSRVLRLSDDDTIVPTAGTVPAALRQLTTLTHARRRLALSRIAAHRHAG